jgi:hypothetical protein
LCRELILPVLDLDGKGFEIIRKEKYGGNFHIKNIDELENKIKSEELHHDDFKNQI